MRAPSNLAALAGSIALLAAAPVKEAGMRPVQLKLVCPEVVKKGAAPDLRAGPTLALELVNAGDSPVEIQEVIGFNLELPDRVRHTNLANASFYLERVGKKPGDQSYSCAEGTGPEPEKKLLAPGERYLRAIHFEPSTLDPGEYEARVTYAPLSLESARCRFKVVK